MGLLETARKNLDELGVKYNYSDDKIVLIGETDHFDNLKIKIMASQRDIWLYIIVVFTSLFKIDESKRLKFLYDMHKKNFEHNGVKFGLDTNDRIVVLTETNDTNLTANELRQLSNSILSACDILYEIYPV